MVIKKVLSVFAAIQLTAFISFGHDHGKKLRAGGISLIEAYTQRILPGRREGRIIKETHFIITWKNKNYPKNFIWLDGDDTLNCNIAKAHKINAGNMHRLPGRSDYYTENIALNKIQKGDTLDITPINGGKAILPTDTPEALKNMLLYTASNKKTLYGFHVDSLTRKQDIAMP